MKKLFKLTKAVLTWGLALVAAAVMVFTVISVNTFHRADRSFFGYRMFIVLSDSMKATDFQAGDLVVSQSVDPSQLREGDIISYQSLNGENSGEIITHKIREVITDDAGQTGFITYGTSTGVNDDEVVSGSQILGRCAFSIPMAGRFFQFLKTVPGYFICIFLPFMLLILLQAAQTLSLYRQYRQNQKQELEEEKARLDAQRRENEEIKAQLLALQKQLEAASSSAPASSQA